MNFFKFHPVGQGLFYTGSLAQKTLNFVYDCGTDSRQKYLLSSIDSYTNDICLSKETKGDIEFVVVSHLHKDHFSGLYHLYRKSKIHTIYLPYLGHDENTISLILAYSIFVNTSENVNDRYDEDLFSLYSFMTNLYGINNYRENKNSEVVFLGEQNDYQQQDGSLRYFTYDKYVSVGHNPYWGFLFINRAISKDRLIQLNIRLAKILEGYGVKRVVDLLDSNDRMKQISEIYRKVFATEINNGQDILNMTSTVLIHYPLYNNANIFYADEKIIIEHAHREIEKRYFNYYPCDCAHFYFKHLYEYITILTGDAIIDTTMGRFIADHIKDSGLNKCGVLQIPHHGAKQNWELHEIDSEIYVVPYGLGNIHRHPHTDTIDNLMTFKRKIKLVNQLQSFEYYIY